MADRPVEKVWRAVHAAHDGAVDRAFGSFFLEGDGGFFEIESDSGREHFNVGDFFGRGKRAQGAELDGRRHGFRLRSQLEPSRHNANRAGEPMVAMT